MAKQTIFRGTLANDGTGDNLRLGANKINDNFTELYTLLGDGSTLATGTVVTTDASQTLTNKTISGANNTISNIPTSALAFNSITIGDDTSTNFNVELGGSFEIVGGSGINTAITNNRIELSTDGSIVTESSTDTLTNKTINLSNNTITGTAFRVGDDSSTNFNVGLGESFEIVGGSGITTAIDNNRISMSVSSVPNSSLANSTITLGSDSIALGATKTSIAGLSLTGSGTIDLTGSGSKVRGNFAGFGSLPSASTYEGMFAYDTTGTVPYVADNGGWVRLQTENDSVGLHSDVNITGVADGYILQWSSGDGRFNVVANTATTPVLKFSDDTSTTARVNADDVQVLGFIGGTNISTVIDDANNTVTISNTMSFGVSKLVGDGSTTAFTINSGRTVNDVLVFVNGICLVPTDDYTISGTTLTFVLAPVGSAEITVRYLG